MFNHPTKSFVQKRDGSYQEIYFAKIQNRLKYLAEGFPSHKCNDANNKFRYSNKQNYLAPLKNINISLLTQKVIKSVVDKIPTNKIDEITASICAENIHIHPDYNEMASRIVISNHHKNTRTKNFLGVTEHLYLIKDSTGISCPLVNKQYYKFVENNYEKIENIIDYRRDYNITYFGFKTLEKSYLLKSNSDKCSVERPQHTWMRLAISINLKKTNFHLCNKSETKLSRIDAMWDQIKNTYDFISLGYYTHASPTIFNSGTLRQQLLSCFLLGSDDSQEGIMKTASDISKISKCAGGIGFHINWRSNGALIRGTNGKSSGPIPFLQIIDKLLCAFNQGGKRPGSGACYMSIDHPDILEFIECRLPHKQKESITPDLFLAVCVRDLFMERVLKNEEWSLFDPDQCPGLLDLFEEEYRKKYINYEKKGKARKTIKARTLLEHIARCRIESGMPYIFYIDMANRKSNQKNIGFIRSSNLCTEIVEFSNSSEYACCTLASICLPKFIEDQNELIYNKKKLIMNILIPKNIREVFEKNILQFIGYPETGPINNNLFPLHPHFNFKKLVNVVRVAFRNLDNIIDLNWYPVPETEISNKRHRPVALGVQGLADVYHKMRIAFNSCHAQDLNKKIFETIYYTCISESCNLAREKYEEYKKILNESRRVDVIVGYRIKREFKMAIDNTYKLKECVKPIYKTYTILSESTSSLSPSSSFPSLESLEENKILPTTSGAYTSFYGSPISKGKFQFDLWNDELKTLIGVNNIYKFDPTEVSLSEMWDWNSLRREIKIFGVRNSLVTALMPTASTSQIMGNNESFEPYTSNLYRRHTMAGQFVCINKYLIHELIDLGIWNKKMGDDLRKYNGSIQNIDGIPDELKNRYKTNYELSQKLIINQESERGPFIDQSQSANRFLNKYKATVSSVTAMDIYAWRKRLKTGQYYLRTEDMTDPQKFTIKPDKAKLSGHSKKKKEDICMFNETNICLSCSG